MLTDILLILVLIVISGAFALSEIAIVSSRRIRLVRMVDTGSAGAAKRSAGIRANAFSLQRAGRHHEYWILSGALGEATVAGHVRQGLEQIPVISLYAEPLALAVVVVSITYVSDPW